MGRFMSPDWSAKEEPVPYASLDDPQSLNLYAYVNNNPLSRFDPDGHNWFTDLFKSVVNEVRFGSFTPNSKVAEIRSIDRHQTNDKRAVAAALAGGAGRLSSAQLRAIWERGNPGQKVPFDELRNRFYDMHHIEPLADCGTNDPENLEPLERGEHMALHMRNGDFSRFASRSIDAVRGMADAIKSGAEDTGRALEDAASEVINNPGEAVQDAAGAAAEAAESGEIPPP